MDEDSAEKSSSGTNDDDGGGVFAKASDDDDDVEAVDVDALARVPVRALLDTARVVLPTKVD